MIKDNPILRKAPKPRDIGERYYQILKKNLMSIDIDY